MQASSFSVRRALLVAASSSSYSSSGVSVLLSQCSSDALESVTFGQQSHSDCAAASNYWFYLITEAPTSDQISNMCAVAACRTVVQSIERVCPTECVLSSTLQLYRDVLTPITTQCGFGSKATSSTGDTGDSNRSSSSPPASSAKGSGSSTDSNQAQTTATADDSSGLGVGVTVSLIVGAVIVVVLAAFAVYRYKRSPKGGQRKGNATGATNGALPYDESAATFEESDDFISQRQYDEFAAVAVSSKVSSGMSRASTASSKQSIGSYSESGLRSSLTVDSAGIQLDDPVLAPLRIRFDQVTVHQLIRSDAFVEVYFGKYKSTPVAIRKLVAERRHNLKDVERFLEQSKIMASLRHERILGFVGVAWETLMLDLCSVSEYATGGDLRSLLRRYAADHIAVGFSHDKIKIALHIAEALSYLHALEPVVVHRNLCPESVLLTQSMDAVLMDVGVASDHLAVLYTAPELVRGEPYGEKTDVYAFGVLLAELDSHELRPGLMSVTFTETAHSDMVAIGLACIARDPRARPSARALVERVNRVLKSYVAFV